MKNTPLNNDVYVRFDHVTKKFGHFTAVSDLSFELHQGEILGFLGPNGAGKSTTMKMLARLLIPTEGDVYIRANGHLEKMSTVNKDYLLSNIGFLIENPTFYGNMTPREILSYFAELKGYPKKKVKKRVEEVVSMIKMSAWIDKKMKGFSKGMRQKIGIVSAIVHDPEIVVLDEPYSGLDPTARKLVRNFILTLKKLGKTVFLSSHLLYEISEVADRIAMISQGRLVALDTLDNLEEKTQDSIIDMELYNSTEKDISILLEKITHSIEPFTGLSKTEQRVEYNRDTGQFEIYFNGHPKNQKSILQALIRQGFEILEFSVSKTDLLENLYMKYMQEPEFSDLNSSLAAEIDPKDQITHSSVSSTI